MACRHLLISGRVQGVFYRAWARETARALGLSGWVRNLADGRVEAVACGPEARLDDFVQRCWNGPPSAAVDDIQLAESAEQPGPGFVVRHGN